MAFFSKKECEICGGKAGMLSREKLKGDGYICGDCIAKCSPELKSGDFALFSPEQIKNHMALIEANAKRFQEDFHPSVHFAVGYTGDKPILDIDEENGWWVASSRKKPDIYTLDEIASWRIELHTTSMSEEERKKYENQSLFDFLFSDDYYTSYPEIPRCPVTHKVTGMDFIIILKENPFGTKKVVLDMMPSFFDDASDVQRAYSVSHQMNLYFENMQRSAPAVSRQAASGTGDALEQIQKLKELLDMGALTQEEFDAKKKQLLGL